MKRLGTVIGAGVLLAALTACAGPEAPGDPGGLRPGAPGSAVVEPDRQPARTPPSGGTAVPSGQVDAEGLAENYPVLVWTEDSGTTVGAVAQEGGCGKASAEVADQTAAHVVVTLVETTPAKPQQCTMDLRFPRLTVQLDQPLGQRQVVLKSEQRSA
ncbi:hypothetical protein V5P93_006000 [Actinokineospora auranticolor]|uniref:Lipoprotein n=1 Tax=Actinokineospora auranticolor TaxID=155976 RepID=A0A2S6GC62_9PSEU|nr:hypothetical protein [Actinokineospora auranticolor]PPK62191.1 hypothetical protein CLV40_1362 [Actinokineospora auranticolor]